MISLRAAISEYERKEELLRAAHSCYEEAVELTGLHLVEAEEEAAYAFRAELEDLARLVKQAATPADLAETRLTLEQGLQDYATRGNEYLRAQRRQLSDTSRALSDLMASLSQNGDDDETRLAQAMEALQEAARKPELQRVCPEIAAIVTSLDDSLERLRQQNRLVVAQLTNELHSLRKTLDRGMSRDGPASLPDVLSRAAMRGAIRAALDKHVNFCLVALRISNGTPLRRKLGGQFSRRVLPDMCERLNGALEDEMVAGQWAMDQFLVYLARPKPEGTWLANHLKEQLAAPYVGALNGRPVDVVLALEAGVLEAAPDVSEARLTLAIDHLFTTLG